MEAVQAKRISWSYWAGIAVVLLFVLVPKVLQPFALRTHAFDTGIYTNVVWNTAHGRFFHTDLLDLGPHAEALGASHLGDHFSPILVFLVPLAWLLPQGWLVVGMCAVQGLAAAVAIVLTYHLALDILRNRLSAGTVALLLAMSQAFSHAVWFEFHPSTLATPFLAGLLLALRKRSLGWIIVCATLLLMCKESAILAGLGAAVYAFVELRQRKVALGLFLAAIVVALFAFLLVMPWARGWVPWPKMSRLGPLAHWDLKWVYLLKLLVSFAFLPLLAPRAFLAALPCIALNLAVAYIPQFSTRDHYDDMVSVLLALAAAHGLSRLLSLAAPRKHLALCMVTLVLGTAFVRGRDGWSDFKRTREQPQFRQTASAIRPWLKLDPHIGVVATDSLIPFFAERDRLILLRPGYPQKIREGDLLILGPKSQGEITPTTDHFPLIAQGPGYQIYRVVDPSVPSVVAPVVGETVGVTGAVVPSSPAK